MQIVNEFAGKPISYSFNFLAISSKMFDIFPAPYNSTIAINKAGMPACELLSNNISGLKNEELEQEKVPLYLHRNSTVSVPAAYFHVRGRIIQLGNQ